MLNDINISQRLAQPRQTARLLSILWSMLLAGLGFAGGYLAVVAVQSGWLAALGTSLSGAEPKAFWELSRAAAFVAFALIWLSMALGLSITNRLARLWPGGPAAADLHQYTSLLGWPSAASTD